MSMPCTSRDRRRPSCWDVAHRRATQARKQRRRRRDNRIAAAPATIVRDLVTSLEGVFVIALMMTVAISAAEMMAGLWRRPAPHPSVQARFLGRPDSVDPPESVHGLRGFEDAFPGECLAEYQERHRPNATAQYRASSRTQARWLSRALAGDKGAASHLMPELRAALPLLDGTAVAHLAGLPRERLAREIPDIVSGRCTNAPACAHPPPDMGPEAAPDDGNRHRGGSDGTPARPPS